MEQCQTRGGIPASSVSARCGWCSIISTSTASQWEAICSVAEKLGADSGDGAAWVRHAEIDARSCGQARTSEELAELKRLKRENAELRRANDILKAAASFFGAELDRQSKK